MCQTLAKQEDMAGLWLVFLKNSFKNNNTKGTKCYKDRHPFILVSLRHGSTKTREIYWHLLSINSIT